MKSWKEIMVIGKVVRGEDWGARRGREIDQSIRGERENSRRECVLIFLFDVYMLIRECL